MSGGRVEVEGTTTGTTAVEEKKEILEKCENEQRVELWNSTKDTVFRI